LNITVVYYSKTGNTKTIADYIAKALECDSIAINLMKHGRKTKLEIDQEKQLFKNAVEKCNQADLLFIGTPTEFRKPHPKIIDLINNLTVKKVAIFCTYYGMLGATFYDLEAILLQKNISIFNKLNLVVGTKKYKFNPDVSQYKDKITSDHLQAAYHFGLNTVTLDKPLSLRLKGICGLDCLECNKFNKSCKGAGYHCWSGTHCELFECCVIRKCYFTCGDCESRLTCTKIINRKNNFA
jgi:flavodoxin